MGVGWAVTSTMIGGIAAWGLIGYLLDRLVGTPNVFSAIGMVLGAVGAIYIVYQRYGKEPRVDG
jgi:ATP synthase protein I